MITLLHQDSRGCSTIFLINLDFLGHSSSLHSKLPCFLHDCSPTPHLLLHDCMSFLFYLNTEPHVAVLISLLNSSQRLYFFPPSLPMPLGVPNPTVCHYLQNCASLITPWSAIFHISEKIKFKRHRSPLS